jgi:selenocysteine lyase/cysteine desulfurase
MVLRCMRSDFSLPEGLHYLDCAYMSPLLRRVEAAGVAGIARKRVPSDIGPDAFFEESSRLRDAFSGMVGGRGPNDVALVPAVSYGMAIVAANLRLGQRANVVIAQAQFPSNVYAWRRACADAGASLRSVAPAGPLGEPTRGATWNRRILEAIDRDTAVVAIDAVHWTDGTWFDLAAIGARAHAVDALFVVDGTQSVGAQPIDVVAAGIDALVCAGYKWLLGPYSTGFAYFGERCAGGRPLEETWLGRAGSEDFRRLVEYRDEYQGPVTRFDVGQRSNFVLNPMSLAAIDQLQQWGVAEVQAYCGDLGDRVERGARALGYAVEDRPWRAAHLLGLGRPRHVTDAALANALAAHGVRVSLRGAAVRVAPHVYNDEADVDALLAALTDAAHTSSSS